jgi:class 3 adenylate cyclase
MTTDERNSPQSLERKLTTILSADVAQYSRLMAEDEEQTLRIFAAHKQIFESVVALHRGRIFNTAGDALLVEFGSVVEAVRCATEVQAALRTRNDQLPPSRAVAFRIGINLGDVLVQGMDLLGDGVNVAARLQSAAEPGGICISGSVYDQIRNKLSLSFKPHGEQKYKNIPQPVRCYSIIEAEDDRARAHPPALLSRRHLAMLVTAGLVAACVLVIIGKAYWSYPGTAEGEANAQATRGVGSAPRIAYVIGNGHYGHLSGLPNAKRDADSVAQALEQRGFKVVKLTDVNMSSMKQAVEEFESTLAVVGGVGLFYYSGKAAHVGGEDILVPVDAREDAKRSKIVGGVNFTQVAKAAKAKTTQLLTNEGYAVIYSASKGEFGDDGPPGRNSPFTAQFLDALSFKEDELADLFRRIGQGMTKAGARQTPYLEDARKVKFYFNKPERDPTRAILKILVFDSCRDNPFKQSIVTGNITTD